MTAADNAGAPSPGVVRPLEARVVRQDWAARAVAPLVDGLEQEERLRRSSVPTEAYADVSPAFYAYRIRRDTEQHLGVVADVSVPAIARGRVREHESVDPLRVDGLVRHYAEVAWHSEPVALLTDFDPTGLRGLTEACRRDPLVHFHGPDGFEHEVWPVTGAAETDEIAAALDAGVHYIADGHHRVAARLRTWEHDGRPETATVLAAVFPLDGLHLSAFHRRVAGPVDGRALLDAAATGFSVHRVPAPGVASGIAVYADGHWSDLVPTGPRQPGAAGLDVAVLHDRLLGPALAITGPEDPRLEVVPSHRPLEVSAARCDEDGGVLFVLAPPAVRTLTEVADLGEVLPPKATYFSPKPCSGVFLTR